MSFFLSFSADLGVNLLFILFFRLHSETHIVDSKKEHSSPGQTTGNIPQADL